MLVPRGRLRDVIGLRLAVEREVHRAPPSRTPPPIDEREPELACGRRSTRPGGGEPLASTRLGLDGRGLDRRGLDRLGLGRGRRAWSSTAFVGRPGSSIGFGRIRRGLSSCVLHAATAWSSSSWFFGFGVGVLVVVVERHRLLAVARQPIRLADVEQQQRLLREQIRLLPRRRSPRGIRRPGSGAGPRRRAAFAFALSSATAGVAASTRAQSEHPAAHASLLVRERVVNAC